MIITTASGYEFWWLAMTGVMKTCRRAGTGGDS